MAPPPPVSAPPPAFPPISAGAPPPNAALDDPVIAAHAWARYKRLMRWMALVTAVTVIVALGVIYAQVGMVSIHFYIASALGVSIAMMLMSALMGLTFLSNATGHDDAVIDPLREDRAD